MEGHHKQYTYVESISTSSMQQTFGHPRATRSIQNKQVVFGIHLNRGTIRTLVFNQNIETHISFMHGVGCLRFWSFIVSFPNQDLLYQMSVLDMIESGITNILQWDALASSQTMIRCHKKLRMGGMNTTCQCLGRKPCKNDRVHRSDSGTRQLATKEETNMLMNSDGWNQTKQNLPRKIQQTYHRHGQLWDHSVPTTTDFLTVRSDTSNSHVCLYFDTTHKNTLTACKQSQRRLS